MPSYLARHRYRLLILPHFHSDKSQVECLIPILAASFGFTSTEVNGANTEKSNNTLGRARNRSYRNHHHTPSSIQPPVQVKYKFCETVFTSRIICHFCIALRRRVESSWAPFNRFSLSFTLLTHTRRCRFPSLFLLLLMLGWLMLALALLFHFATA